MAYQQRPARGRGGNQRAQYTRTAPPPPPPPFNGPYYEPSARGRGGNQRAQYTRTAPPPPPFNGPYYEPSARGLDRYQRDVAAGLVIGAVGAAAIMSGYDVPAYGGYLPPTTGFVATGIEELATAFYDSD